MLDTSIVLRSLNNACIWLDASETQSLNTVHITVANQATSRTCEAIPRPTEPSNFNQMNFGSSELQFRFKPAGQNWFSWSGNVANLSLGFITADFTAITCRFQEWFAYLDSPIINKRWRKRPRRLTDFSDYFWLFCKPISCANSQNYFVTMGASWQPNHDSSMVTK